MLLAEEALTTKVHELIIWRPIMTQMKNLVYPQPRLVQRILDSSFFGQHRRDRLNEHARH